MDRSYGEIPHLLDRKMKRHVALTSKIEQSDIFVESVINGNNLIKQQKSFFLLLLLHMFFSCVTNSLKIWKTKKTQQFENSLGQVTRIILLFRNSKCYILYLNVIRHGHLLFQKLKMRRTFYDRSLYTHIRYFLNFFKQLHILFQIKFQLLNRIN